MRPAAGWHGYWLNPGDAGLPMDVKWQLPRGFSAGPLRYPVPTRLEIAGLMNYVYERDYAVLVRLKVPADARGTIPSAPKLIGSPAPTGSASPSRANCRSICRSGPGLRSGRNSMNGGADSAAARHIGSVSIDRRRLRVAIPLPRTIAVPDPYVFPIDDGIVDYAAPQKFFRDGDRLVAHLKSKPGDPKELARRSCARRRARARVPRGSAAGRKQRHAARRGRAGRVLWAVLGALAGGVLLNLMPCVFPILALKALHISKAGESAFEARRDALGYAAGAVVGTGVLGVALLAIRAAGAEAGWAFQLQDPRTIMLLLLLAVAITANLLGAFELPVLGGRRGRRAVSGPVRSPPSSRRLAPDRSSARRSAPPCCCRSPARCWCSPRSVLASQSLSCWSPSSPRCEASCRSPGRG